jgi:hypothetical protein
VDALRLMKLDREIEEMRSEAAEADRAGEAERRDTLLAQILELSKQRAGFLPAAQVSKQVN